MQFKSTEIKDLIIFEPKIFNDIRGYFFESYNKNLFLDNDIDINFVQDNQSFSSYGTIRGLHFQTGEYAQSKLIRVIKGEILDVVVDIRKNSKTFGKVFYINLSEANQLQLLIPKGMAHGFAVLSKDALILYKCDNFYNKESEQGILYNDQDLNIDWQISKDKQILSEKDLQWQGFNNYKDTPCF